MSTKYRFFHRARVRAAVETCWDVFTDHERIGEFTMTPMKILEPGRPERNGLGCVRRMETLGWTVDEIVNYWRPQELFGYHIIGADFVTHHQGIVRFWRLPDGGTEWVYDMQVVPSEASVEQAKAAGLPDFEAVLAPGFRRYMADLEAECERRGASFEVPAAPLSVHERAARG